MRKRYWIILVILFICVDLIIFYALYPSSPAYVPSISPEQEENETQTPWKFPKITFPWSTEESEGEGAGGSGGSEGSEGAGGEGGEEGELPLIDKNYTLFVNSTHNLEILVIYTVNNIVFNETKSLLPFSLEVQENSYVCLSETTASGTIRWLIDNEIDCPFTDCGVTPFDCSILMDKDHSVTLRQYT